METYWASYLHFVLVSSVKTAKPFKSLSWFIVVRIEFVVEWTSEWFVTFNQISSASFRRIRWNILLEGTQWSAWKIYGPIARRDDHDQKWFLTLISSKVKLDQNSEPASFVDQQTTPSCTTFTERYGSGVGAKYGAHIK